MSAILLSGTGVSKYWGSGLHVPDPLVLEHQGQHNIQVDCSYMWLLLFFAIHHSGGVLRGNQRGL